jgi:hypothetical protein
MHEANPWTAHCTRIVSGVRSDKEQGRFHNEVGPSSFSFRFGSAVSACLVPIRVTTCYSTLAGLAVQYVRIRMPDARP